MGSQRRTRAGHYFTKATLAGGVAASVTALTLGLAAPSATAAATPAGADAVQYVDKSGRIIPTAVAEALAEVLRAYAEGAPPTRFPAELRALFEDLDQLGPELLSALGSEENVGYLRSLDFGFLFEDLGLDLPDLGDLLTAIPASFPIGEEEIALPLNIITTGAPFGALSLLGLNPLWAPGLPDAIARDINGTPYADIDTTLRVPPTTIVFTEEQYQQFRQQAYDLAYNETYDALCPSGCNLPQRLAAQGAARLAAEAARALVPREITAGAEAPLALRNYRIPIVLGFGLGSLAAGMAYPQVVADLANQPGGTGETAADGSSLTILPLILLRNPGRANGGIAARFGSFADLIGLNTVTPDMDVERDGDAVLVPVKLDATVEFDPLSDFPAWQNPFSLANSAAALVFPTYILRGTDIDNLDDTVGRVLEPVLGSVLGNVLSAVIGDGVGVDVSTELLGFPVTLPLNLSRGLLLDLAGDLLPDEFALDIPEEGFEALNEYLTLRSGALPLLEPFRIPVDLLNIATGGNFSNPFADAVEDALRILVNLGYTDVDQDNGYRRTHDQAGLNADGGGVPFGTRPDIDWARVPEDVVTALVAGIQREFLGGGIPGINDAPRRNPIADVLTALGLTASLEGLRDLGDLIDRFPGFGDIVDGVFGGGSGGGSGGLPSATSLPDTDAVRAVTLIQPAATESATPQSLPVQETVPTGSRTVTAEKAVTPAPPAPPAQAASARTDDAADDAGDTVTPGKRPRLNVITGRGDTVTESPVRGATTDNRVRDSLRDVRSPVTKTPQQSRPGRQISRPAATDSGRSARSSTSSATP